MTDFSPYLQRIAQLLANDADGDRRIDRQEAVDYLRREYPSHELWDRLCTYTGKTGLSEKDGQALVTLMMANLSERILALNGDVTTQESMGSAGELLHAQVMQSFYMAKAIKSDLTPEAFVAQVQHLLPQQRMNNYAELAGLSHALTTMGISVDDKKPVTIDVPKFSEVCAVVGYPMGRAI